MGNKQTKSKPVPSQPVRPPLADSSDEEDEGAREIDEEAEVFIRLEIFHELPHGSTIQHIFTVNPKNTVKEIKESLSTILDIPWQDMQIYRHQNPQTEMPNDGNLNSLVVPNNEQLRVRDKRKIYTNPIIVQD